MFVKTPIHAYHYSKFTL